MQGHEADITAPGNSTPAGPATGEQVGARPLISPNSLLKSQAGGMILLTFGILGCVLIAWGFQRNAKRKLAAQEDEYLTIVRERTNYLNSQGYRSRKEGSPEPRRESAAARSQSELAADVAEIATLRQDLRDLGRKVVEDIDARLASLEAVIERAEAVAQRLESSAGAAAPAPAPIASPARRADAYVEAAPPREVSATEVFPRLSPAGGMHDPRSPRDETRTIIELAEQGVAAREIAQRLRRPIGQVELILALRGKGTPVAR